MDASRLSPLTIHKTKVVTLEDVNIKKSNPLIPISIITCIAYAALVAVAFLFAPMAAAITFTVVAALAIGFFLGLAKGAEVARRCIICPLANRKISVDKEIKEKQYTIEPQLLNTEFKLSDGAVLRGACSMKNLSLRDNSNKKIVFFFNGNIGLSSIESINEIQSFFPDEYDAITLDSRGMGHSDGEITSNKKTVKDFIEVLEYLLSLGYKQEHITLYGTSLGGTIATQIKEHFDKKPKDDNSMTLICYHTFSNLTKTAQEKVRESVSNHLITPANEQAQISKLKKFNNRFFDYIDHSIYSIKMKKILKEHITSYTKRLTRGIQDLEKPTNANINNFILDNPLYPDTKIATDLRYPEGMYLNISSNLETYTTKLTESLFPEYRPSCLKHIITHVLYFIITIIEKLTPFVMMMTGWDYKFSATRWKSLKGRKFAIGGGFKDYLTNYDGSLAYQAAKAGCRRSAYIRDADHVDAPSKEMISKFLEATM